MGNFRKYLLRQRLSKGPNKVVLSPVDFVFPVDSRRVDEGIEAMLCCFLQQLQEFGGPEVDKPDGIKGSNSSLKTVGLPATQNKNNNNNTSGSGSLARHNTVLDMRARYNVWQDKSPSGGAAYTHLLTHSFIDTGRLGAAKGDLYAGGDGTKDKSDGSAGHVSRTATREHQSVYR